jgi:hypothetical protein
MFRALTCSSSGGPRNCIYAAAYIQLQCGPPEDEWGMLETCTGF